MTRPLPLLVLVLTLVACSKEQVDTVAKARENPLPKGSALTQKEVDAMSKFEAPYFSRWRTLTPVADPYRPQVQLAMPSEQGVALWYSWKRGPDSCLGRKQDITVSVDGAPNTSWIHSCIQGFKTGRIEIPGLTASKTYKVSVTLGTQPPKVLTVQSAPPSGAPSPKSMSFLAFSCNKPYLGPRPGILARDLNTQLLMSQRAQGAITSARLPARPAFALGLGDNIYVDPDADEDKDTFRLSFFTGTRTEEALIDLTSAREYLDVVYRYVFGIPSFATMMENLPVALTMDDHEIRDGWGSQGDEGLDIWLSYFDDARDAFLAYQALRNTNLGERAWADVPKDGGGDVQTDVFGVTGEERARADLFSSWNWGEQTRFFLMDLRSSRNKNARQLMSEPQWSALEAWFSSAPKDKPILFVLGSSVPLTSAFDGQQAEPPQNEPPQEDPVLDDVLDQWESSVNFDSHRRIEALLAQHFRANPEHKLLVLSGDIHRSEVYFLKLRQAPGEYRVFGHEVVSSGLSNSTKERPVKPLLRTTQEEIVGSDAAILSIMRGVVSNSPNFAEIVIDRPTPEGPPQVGVVFYPATTPNDQAGEVKLANLATSPSWGRSETRVYDYSPTPASIRKDARRGNVLYVPLTYGENAPLVRCNESGKGQKVYDIMQAQSLHCQTKADADILAQRWETIFDVPVECGDVDPLDPREIEPCE